MSDGFNFFDALSDLGDHSAGGFMPTQQTGQSVQQVASQANRALDRSVEASLEVERLRLVTQALWEFLREKHGVTDADLEARIQEIDLRDGKGDNKIDRQVAICGQCHRKTGVRTHRRCFYCGSLLDKEHIVER